MTDSAMTCNVCGSPYTLPEDEVVGNLPHVLLCGHIFCVPCLRALVSPQGVITCPDCQMGTEVDEEGVDGLQVDSRIIGLIYTAKMNSKRSCHGRHRWRGRRVGSLPSPPPAHPTQNAGTDQDLVKVLDEALCKATENLNTLDSLHQSVVQGIQTELKREKTRITKEIEDCIDKATGILHRRRGVLLSELNQVEQLFSTGREECRRVEARRKELFTVMQKARHIRQVPSLRTCCHLAQILETLQEPVDADSFDRSCLTLCSGLSCVLHVDSLTESVGNCLKIMDRKVNLASEPAQLDPSQPMRNGGSGKRRTGQGSSGLSASPETAQEDLHTRTPVDPADGHNTDLLPSFIIEEIIEEADNSAERDGMEPKHREGQKVQRRNRKVLHDRTPGSHQKALQVWVVLSHLINPTHFYVRYMTERKAGVALARKINRFCSDARSHFVVRDQLSTGMMVFVRSKEEVWCRALVCELFQKGCLESVSQCPISEVARLQVFFQDYGFSKGLTISGDEDLSELNRCLRRADLIAQSDLHHWAPLAIRCSLKDIIPSDLVKGWSEEACQEMKHVIGSNAVEMQVFDQDGDTLLVDLKKVSTDNTKNTPLSLREHLVFMELARFYSPLAISGGSKPLQFYPPVHPRLNMELNAVVSHVNTPSDFYVQLVDSSDFLLLNTKLQNHYGSPGAESKLQIYCPVLAQACVALYNSKDWCRAQVTGFSGGQLVEVRYVDFGNKTTLPVTNLRQIKDEFFALPAMALWCSLADVVSLEHTWSDESIRVFRELTENKLVTVVATKHVSQYTAIPVCVCEVREHSSEHLASIGEILARKGLASLCKQVLVTEPPLLETVVWDPPLDESPLAAGEPVPLIPDPSEVQPNLTLPTSLKDLRVRVTHVTSPGNICVQLLQSDAQLKRIHDLLSREYLKSEPKEVNWKAEMTCAANVNGVWERGKVYSVSSGSLAEVLRCDFGNMVKLHTSNLRPLVPELIGSLLLECCLSDVRPAGGCSTWTATACEFISYYLTGALAIMTIKDPSAARPMPISLYCSNRAGQDVSIADFLISEGLALRERSVKAAAQRKPDPTLSEEISCPPEGILAGQDECVSTLEDIVREDGDQRSQQWCTSPPKHAPSPTSPPAVRTQAYLPPELPPRRLTRMSICAVSDNGVIYTMTPQTECEFERLQESLQQHIKTLPRQKSYNWKKVLGCAVMGSDMLWYRGQVQEVIGGHVKVQYVDQGIVENIPVCHVYPKVLCETVPQLCVPCQINGVIPVGTVWQWDAVALMKELLLGRTFDVQVVELPEDPRGLVTVEIMLDGMPLSRLMVYHQHATAVPGSSSLEDYVVKAPVPDLDDWDITIEGLEDPSAILGVYSNPKLPDKGKLFQVQIKHIRAPNEVFLSLLDTQECEGETLEEALERVNSDAASLAQLTDFPIEGPCLAQYRDGKYYRAKLLGFAELSPSVRLLVRHVDFGSDDILLPYELRCLPSSLLRFPCGAVCVWLAGFKPQCACVELERVSYRPEWSMRAMLEMIDLLHGCLSAMVTAVEPQLIVYLYNADGTLVHVPLVEKGLAEYD